MIGLVLLGNDLGTDMVLVAILLAVLFVVGAPVRLFAMLGGGMVVAVALLSVTAPHRLDRFRSWLNPDADYLGRRLAGRARAVRPGQRRLVGTRARRRPGEVGRAARGAHRLHLRGDRRGARA